MIGNAGDWQLRTRTEADGTGVTALRLTARARSSTRSPSSATTMTRNGSAIRQPHHGPTLRYARLAVSNTFTAIGAGSTTAAIVIDAASPLIRYNENDQAVDSRTWLLGPSTGVFRIRADSRRGRDLTVERYLDHALGRDRIASIDFAATA